MRKKQELVLNGVKGIAACIIAFIWHYQHFQPDKMQFYSIFPFSYNYGYLMVELFFMISGFGLMFGYYDRIKNKEIDFKKFMYLRIKKLYPFFFLTLIMITILQLFYMHRMGVTFVYPNFDVYHFVLNLFLLQNGLFGTEWSFNSPSWCLSIFVVLYILFYLIIRYGKKKNVVIGLLVCSFIVSMYIMLMNFNYPIFNQLMARGISCFSIGMLLYFMYEKKDNYNTKTVGYISLTILILLYILFRFSGDVHFGNMNLVFILFISPLIILSSLYVPFLKKILSLNFLQELGKISFIIYLLHFPIQCFIKIIDIYFGFGFDYSSYEFYLIYCGVVLICSFIYYYAVSKYYQKFFCKVKNKLIYSK